jgi:hypothetical protein
VGGVTGRNHAQLACRVSQGRSRPGLQNVALQSLFLLRQRIVEGAGAAELVGPLRRRGRQPQGDAQAEGERADNQHHERDPGQQRPGAKINTLQAEDHPLTQRWPD